MDFKTKVLAIIVGAVMLLIPMSLMFVGVNITNEGMDELNTLLVDYPELVDAIIKISGGLTVVLFGCMILLLFLIISRTNDSSRLDDGDDIENQNVRRSSK